MIEFKDHLKVSFRSDGAALAVHFGGGHHMSSSFRSEGINMKFLLKEIIKEIKKRGLINGS